MPWPGVAIPGDPRLSSCALLDSGRALDYGSWAEIAQKPYVVTLLARPQGLNASGLLDRSPTNDCGSPGNLTLNLRIKSLNGCDSLTCSFGRKRLVTNAFPLIVVDRL